MTSFSCAFLVAAGFLFAADFPAQPAREAVAANVSVIELYTSQGCAACPEADRLFNRLAERPGLLVLSFPINYWDYLGWKDTLARPENAKRQLRYARTLGNGEVYTPQAIINGMSFCIGSSLADIEKAVRATSPLVSREAVPLTVRIDGGKVLIEAGGAPEGSRHRKGKVWVAAVQRSLAVKISRGENAGRTVTYANVVRDLAEAGDWRGDPISFAVPLSALSKEGDMYVVFLQMEELGPILAAARIAPSR